MRARKIATGIVTISDLVNNVINYRRQMQLNKPTDRGYIIMYKQSSPTRGTKGSPFQHMHG